ncbi:sigma-70 family RNA polymerase sigma factor [Dyella sp. 20L07]|uniref:sigma-70 family RNA polymerase sigma factor n=1 Tax=Dyella sp. 20L07 TaxID=3384240 RepID=UPI003D29AD82
MLGTTVLSGDLPKALADALTIRPSWAAWHGPHKTDGATLAALSSLSDEACMSRYQRGDTAAFRVLYLRYRDKLHRYVLRLAGNHGEAEEVFQEAWVSVIRGRDVYQSERSFAAWLFALAHRRAADRWRALSRHAPDWQHRADSGEDDSLDPPVPAVSHTPEAAIQNDALRDALLVAVEALPLPQREAFLLRAEAELGLEDIATITGVSRETVKSRLRYAQRRLREALGAWR